MVPFHRGVMLAVIRWATKRKGTVGSKEDGRQQEKLNVK